MKGKTVEAVLMVLVLVMFSGYFMIRHEILNDQAFIKKVDKTITYIEQDKWDYAAVSSRSVRKEWERTKYIIMVNDAEADIALMEEYLALFVKGTENKDKNNALSSAAYLKENWTNINKFVPQP